MPTLLVSVVILGLAGLVTILVAFRRQERRMSAEHRRAADALTRSRALAESDLALLRTDLTLQTVQVTELAILDPDLATPMQAHLHELGTAVENLATELSSADAPERIQYATAAMSHVRQALATLAARLVDDPVPPVRTACFFNPNHGPSSTIVMWQGEDDRPVRVPCCASDAERLRSGAAPYSRTVAHDGVRVPWWEAGPTVRPWALGWFSDPELARSFPTLLATGGDEPEQVVVEGHHQLPRAI